MLTNSDLIELTQFRRALHRRPEISGEEEETARTIQKMLQALKPNRILTGLGGHGVAAEFCGETDGPTLLFRAELDALPIEEISTHEWKSEISGKGHLCGHDGHMTFLIALGRLLARNPPQSGRVILMFQPAEEDGSGARSVVADPRYADIKPDYAFAIHNEPGRPLGYVSLQDGLMNCASLGLLVHLAGKTAHAADPQDGRSPTHALAQLIPALDALGQSTELDDEFRQTTITHIQMGEPTFGIAPGSAKLHVTLRTTRDETLTEMADQARSIATSIAQNESLSVSFEDHDHFAASINDREAVEMAQHAMEQLNIPFGKFGLPMRASEDFGVFGWNAKAAMLCLGSGEHHPALHNPDFDFPDDLIPIGTAIFDRIIRNTLDECISPHDEIVRKD